MVQVMAALLAFKKVCLLVQENNKIDLKFMRLGKCNSYIRLIGITALVLCFIENLKRKINKDTLTLKAHS